MVERLSSRRVAVTFIALLTAVGVYLMWTGRSYGFYYDEITWIVTRSTGLHAILASYNNHLLIVPLAVYRILFETVGLQHFWVYRLLGIVCHLACISAVFLFARRRVGPAALLLVVPLLVLGSGWDYVLWPVNLGFTASLALSITALTVAEADTPRRSQVACGMLLIAMGCSEFTTVFALGLAVELSWRDRSPRRAWVWLAPLVAYALWWAYFHEPSSAAQNLAAAPAYALTLAASAAGGLFGLDVAWGRVVIVAAIVLGVAAVRHRGLTPRGGALLVAAGSFWLLVALGRAQLGDPTASRYIYTGAVLIALLGAELGLGLVLTRGMAIAGGLAMLISLAGNINALHGGEYALRIGSAATRADFGAVALVENRVPGSFAIDPHFLPGIYAGPYLAATRKLGSSPADTPAQILAEPELAREAADSVLERAGEVTAVSGRTSTAASPGKVHSAGAASNLQIDAAAGGTATRTGRCVVFHSGGAGAALDLTLPSFGLILTASPGPSVDVRARRIAAQYGNSLLATLVPGQPLTVSAAGDGLAQPWHVRVSPNQDLRACPAQ